MSPLWTGLFRLRDFPPAIKFKSCHIKIYTNKCQTGVIQRPLAYSFLPSLRKLYAAEFLVTFHIDFNENRGERAQKARKVPNFATKCVWRSEDRKFGFY